MPAESRIVDQIINSDSLTLELVINLLGRIDFRQIFRQNVNVGIVFQLQFTLQFVEFIHTPRDNDKISALRCMDSGEFLSQTARCTCYQCNFFQMNLSNLFVNRPIPILRDRCMLMQDFPIAGAFFEIISLPHHEWRIFTSIFVDGVPFLNNADI